ncbi:MAG: hypothetical protein A2075_15595 [Geobacteraceae bacterium GWC2_58_44]|nr:MAG: hypothetical protein A2075_15595 [Geobacteraceae bacterium GWC2_58_44]HBG06008.1 hypothetical protein [Geobacter sp.]
MSTVVTVHNLGKKYTLSHRQGGDHASLRDMLTDGISGLGSRLLHPFNPSDSGTTAAEDFWALNQVSFNVRQGERIGIIGKNGAGKSTLLKILSRITEPTTGSVRIRGRVASLLEVGTGFHPELTGRENIYLNGAILGMSRAEIRKNFDRIVDFSEIEKFLDTPVKRYSSGMYVRLAFAVAAHLEPEILIVDEVLAVGDAAFQKKCLSKMEEVGSEGRTVLFVSHNTGAILQLCSRALILEQGMLTADGDASVVANEYLARVTAVPTEQFLCDVAPNTRVWIRSASLRTPEGAIAGTVPMSQEMRLVCRLTLAVPANITLSVQIKELNGTPVYHFPNADSGTTLPNQPGNYQVEVAIPPLWLYPGKYAVQLTLNEVAGQLYEMRQIVDTLGFVSGQDFAACPRTLGRHAGLVFAQVNWQWGRVA